VCNADLKTCRKYLVALLVRLMLTLIMFLPLSLFLLFIVGTECIV